MTDDPSSSTFQQDAGDGYEAAEIGLKRGAVNIKGRWRSARNEIPKHRAIAQSVTLKGICRKDGVVEPRHIPDLCRYAMMQSVETAGLSDRQAARRSGTTMCASYAVVHDRAFTQVKWVFIRRRIPRTQRQGRSCGSDPLYQAAPALTGRAGSPHRLRSPQSFSGQSRRSACRPGTGFRGRVRIG